MIWHPRLAGDARRCWIIRSLKISGFLCPPRFCVVRSILNVVEAFFFLLLRRRFTLALSDTRTGATTIDRSADCMGAVNCASRFVCSRTTLGTNDDHAESHAVGSPGRACWMAAKPLSVSPLMRLNRSATAIGSEMPWDMQTPQNVSFPNLSSVSWQVRQSGTILRSGGFNPVPGFSGSSAVLNRRCAGSHGGRQPHPKHGNSFIHVRCSSARRRFGLRWPFGTSRAILGGCATIANPRCHPNRLGSHARRG
jgi:hypothetical protein